MGVRLEYVFPSFTTAATRGLLGKSEAHIVPEHGFDAAPRYLLAMFMPDGPGILRSALRLFKDGVEPNGVTSQGSERIRFSVEGSVTSAVSDNFLMAFVLKPYPTSCLGGLSADEVRESLETAVVERFSRDGSQESGDLSERVLVFNFDARDDALFPSTHFTEYRFTTADEGARRLKALGTAMQQLSAVAGAEDIPIAYAYFPTTLNGDARSELTARVAVARSESISQGVRLDAAAINACASLNLRLQKYRPDPSLGTLDERFAKIVDFRQHVPEADHTEQSCEGKSRAIFVTGEARVGFVADMLSNGVAPQLTGGTMTVLGGHTIACWVCPEDLANVVQQQIKQNCPAANVVGCDVPVRLSSTAQVLCDLWITWKVPDRAGVFLHIAESVQERLSAGFGEGALQPDYEYSISRVIEGHACAGKLRLRVMGAGLGASQDDVVSALKEAIRSSAWWVEQFGHYSSSHDVHLEVSTHEPGEEPWATLIHLGVGMPLTGSS